MSDLFHTGAEINATPKPSRLKGFFMAVVHEVQVRRALREVGALDDAGLMDIGLSRGNLENAVRSGRR